MGEARVVGGRRPAVLDGHGDVDLPVQDHREARVALGVLHPDADAGRRGGEPGHGRRHDLRDAGGEGGHRDGAGLPAPYAASSASARSSWARTAWVWLRRISPAGVSRTPLAPRSTRRWPVSCSSAVSCWETAEG